MSGKSNFVSAITLGVITTAITGAFLILPATLLMSHLSDLWVSEPLAPLANWQGAFIMLILFIALSGLSIFLAAFAGGWICAKRSGKDHEYSHALFLSVLWVTVTAILYAAMENPPFKLSVAVIILGPAGYFGGAGTQIRKKQQHRS